MSTNRYNKEDDLASITAFQTAVIKSIMKTRSLDGINLINRLCLDPYFKSLKFVTDDFKESVREKLS